AEPTKIPAGTRTAPAVTYAAELSWLRRTCAVKWGTTNCESKVPLPVAWMAAGPGGSIRAHGVVQCCPPASTVYESLPRYARKFICTRAGAGARVGNGCGGGLQTQSPKRRPSSAHCSKPPAPFSHAHGIWACGTHRGTSGVADGSA